MEKSIINVYGYNTCEYVILHAMFQKKKGKKATTCYQGIRNPKKSLEKALEDYCVKNKIDINQKNQIAKSIDSLRASCREKRDNLRWDNLISRYNVKKFYIGCDSEHHEKNARDIHDEAMNILRVLGMLTSGLNYN